MQPPDNWGARLLRKAAAAASSGGFLMLLLVATTLIMSELSEHFLSWANLFEITRLVAEVGLISLGMTLVIITAGIDLSVGSIVGLTAVVMGALHGLGLNAWLAAAAAVLCGLALGLLNATLIVRLRLPALIVTLATLAIYRGAALGLSRGKSFGDFPDSFLFLGNGYVFGIVPTQLLLLLVMATAVWAVLTRTAYGRFVFAIGRNAGAAHFAGVDVQRVQLWLYAGVGALSGLAAVVYVARVSSAKADAGTGYELDAITAVVLGGAAITGGAGSVWNSLLGLLLVGLVRNGLTLAFIPPEVQNVIIGGLLLLAVLVNQLLRRWELSRARRHAATFQRVRA